ncbi:MAG: NAD-dependent protein deacylase [Deltaproteobacteria bacterium]|nr:NAD-dependent protein deacylase [Deltaproteobacteria bacterium]
MRLIDGQRLVVLSGAGLSKASGIPTFRDADGLWEQHRLEEVATPQAWRRDPDLVRRFYDERRMNALSALPNPAHEALVRLQHALGRRRVTLITQNVDGLLEKAGAIEVLAMHGSLWGVRCERDEAHPHLQIAGVQSPGARCSVCGAPLRPDIVWFGEQPQAVDRVTEALERCDVFLSVGTSGLVYPAAGFALAARARGAVTIEVNPEPSGGAFDEVIAKPAEEALPCLVADWLGEASALCP